VHFAELDGKIIGLYFAANWYPKCEAFTPVLAAAYQQLKARGAGFEVVLVSCDEDRPSFERFHRTMPWPAVPFGDLRCKKRLSGRFQVEGIPRLVVLAPDGEVVHPDAADLVHRYGEGAFPCGGGDVADAAEAPFLAWRLNVVAPAPAPAPAFAVWPERAGLFQYN